MTTTVLSSFASSYAVGLRHVHFNLRSSTPTTGLIHEGHGEWYVTRGGAIVSTLTAIGGLVFAAVLQDGDIVTARYIDRAGAAGADVTYTASVTGTASYVQHVSAAGNDANNGTTEGLAVLTFAQAWTNMMASLGSGQVGEIRCRRGDTFTSSAVQSFSGSSQRLVIVTAYGSGARPILRWPTNTNGISVGDWGSVHLRGVDMDGQDAGLGDSGSINYTRTTPNGPVNLLISDCVLRNWTWSIRLTGTNGENGSNWTDGRGDFVAIVDTTCTNAGSIHLFSSFAQRYTLLRDVTMGDTNGENNDNIWRVTRWKDHFLQRVTWTPGNNASLRNQAGPSLGATDIWGPGSWLNCTFNAPELSSQHFLSKWGFGRTAPDGTGEGFVTDVRLVGCRGNRVEFDFVGNTLTRVQLWNCQAHGGGFRLRPDAGALTPGTVTSIEFRDCAHVDDDGYQCFWFQSAPARYAAGSITITGFAHWVRTGTSQLFISTDGMTMAELIGKLAVSNRNHVGQQTTGTYNWAQATDQAWGLAFWQANSGGLDANSSLTSSVGTANFTNVGTTLSAVDLRRTSSTSFVNDVGLARVLRDSEGRIRSATTPDAGPFEFGAALPTPPATGGSSATRVRLKSTAATTFTGWVRINTDQTVAAAYGIKGGVQFVKGNATGRDTTAVDLYVTMAPGAAITLANLVPDTATPPDAVTPTPSFAGGTPSMVDPANGTSYVMTQVSTATDGQATVEEWKVRVGVWVVRMWTRWYPNEPWIHAEVVVTFSDPTYTAATAELELQRAWPGYVMTWGTGTTTIAGRTAASGDLIAAGTLFGDAQSRAFPVLWKFTNRLRGDGTADTASIAALEQWAITGHGIANLWRDGNPYLRPDAATYTATQKPGSLARLHNWTASPLGITARSENSGRQDDQVFVFGEAQEFPEATMVAYLEGFRWAARPCHHLETDGSFLNLAGHPQLRLWNSRPHPTQSPDRLGKTFLLPETDVPGQTLSSGWLGADWEHWFFNGLMAGARYTGSPALQWLMRAQATVYLFTKFPDVPTFGSFASVQSTRDLVWEPIIVVHLWENLTDRTLATTVRDRFYARCSSSGDIRDWITNAPFGDIWDVRFQPTSSTGSIPFAPGWIPWQQGPACWSMDYALRAFTPELNVFAADLLASALRVMNDCYNFEGGRWVEYERQELPPPDGLGRESRSGFFTVDWFPPCILYVLTQQPSNTTAQAIWAQMLNDTLTGADPARRRWLPPNSVAPSGGGNTGTANGAMQMGNVEAAGAGEVTVVALQANGAMLADDVGLESYGIRNANPLVSGEAEMGDMLLDCKCDLEKGETPQPGSAKKARNLQLNLGASL